MCLNAIDFLGEAMSCTSKDSVLVNTLNCHPMHCMDSSAWCTTDSRDDEQKEGIVTESSSEPSSSSLKPSLELEGSNDINNNNKNNNNESSTSTSRKGVSDELSNSVHQLLHDSIERTNLSQSHRTDSSTTLLSVPEGDSTIFRTHDDTNDRTTTLDVMEKTRSTQDEEGEEESKSDTDTDTHTQGVQFSKLQRCTAWSQADDQNCHIYSFEDDNTCRLLLLSPDTTTHDEAKVNLVHWDDIVHGVIECQETPIFRPTQQDVVGPQFKLDRCAAWSVDDSSNNSHSLTSARGSVRLGAIQEETSTTKIHWDAIVKDSIYA